MSAFRAWLPALAWAGTIFFLSSRPHLVDGPELIPHFDKVAHFGAYALLGLLLAHAVRASGLPLVVAIALGWLYGISDEWHQSFVPGRSVDAWAGVAGALGVLAGGYRF